MNYYETLYIVHPALESGRLKDIIMGVEDSLKKMGGDPLAIELWGKRKLAYFIDKQKYGTYVLIQYNGKGKCTRDFAVELEHNPNILAYLTTNIDQDDVIEQDDDLETQIAGKTREAERGESRYKKDGNKESAILDDNKQDDKSTKITTVEELSSGGDEQTSSKTEVINEEVLSDDNELADVSKESKKIDENTSAEEDPAKEKVLKSNQDKTNESATIGEEE